MTAPEESLQTGASCGAAVPWQIPVHAAFDPGAGLLRVGCPFQQGLPLTTVSAATHKLPQLLQSMELAN